MSLLRSINSESYTAAAAPIADLMTAIVTVIMISAEFRELKKREREPSIDSQPGRL
ncbi:MAG: hypothetical protein LUF32_02760 [Clostridiales bacterium]|nr:hypothetical protein [Clostridiales bacterium]